MQVRNTVIELFSTFIQFSGDRFDGWISDGRLKKRMEDHWAQANQGSRSEFFWALYWYKLWQGQNQQNPKGATAHLNAYLQEPCYWATQSIVQRFAAVQWTLADGFQTAIAQTDRILKGYRPDYGSSLKGYARTAFSNLIRDHLRQQQDIHICSDWGLLRRLSHAQIQESLLTAGLTQTESYILAWQCFKAVYVPDPQRSVRALPPPTVGQLIEMAERYNQVRIRQDPSPPRIESDALKSLLTQTVQAARAYLSPTVTSLHQSPFESEGSKTQLDDLSDDETPMDQLLIHETYVEQQQQVQHIQNVLRGAIATLPPADQRLLRLYYREALTQMAIAQELQIKQYQVSRQLSRVRQTLLMAVAQWSQETLHISINSAVLASMSDAIHEWLQQHYQSTVDQSKINP